jgi:hypothetical protein
MYRQIAKSGKGTFSVSEASTISIELVSGQWVPCLLDRYCLNLSNPLSGEALLFELSEPMSSEQFQVLLDEAKSLRGFRFRTKNPNATLEDMNLV